MPKTRSKMGSLSRSQHAEVAWCTEDIQDRRPDWSAKRCFAFLMDNEDEIQCRMIDEGWEAIKDLLPREE
jgi:hypothetical protein